MMNKVLIFTPYSITPFHVRLETVSNALIKMGFKVEIKNYSTNQNKYIKLISIITLWYFDIIAIVKAIFQVHKCNIVYIQDLRLLPIAIFAKLMGKKVIYETLDNNVYLHTHFLKTKYKIPFTSILAIIHSQIEKLIAKLFTNLIIVNSKALHGYFNNKSLLLFYSSPFENIKVLNNVKNTNAFLFLGAFTKSKGALEIIEIVSSTQMPIYIFGDIPEDDVKEQLNNINKLTHITNRLSSLDLTNKLKALLAEKFLIGFSLIKPENYSYATQEANKDIDYMAMGIPIIGNTRIPTFEKVNNGCGILNNINNITKLLLNNELKAKISKICVEYYSSNYSYNLFYNTLQKSLQKLCIVPIK